MMPILCGFMLAVLLTCEVQGFYKQPESPDAIICTDKNMFAHISKHVSDPREVYIYVQGRFESMLVL